MLEPATFIAARISEFKALMFKSIQNIVIVDKIALSLFRRASFSLLKAKFKRVSAKNADSAMIVKVEIVL